MGTTSLGIAYPASTDNYRPHTDMQAMAEDVDALLVAAPGAWASYTPAWTSTGTAPAIGNGTATGRYLQPANSKLVIASVRILMGGTTTYGTGGYSFSLPVTAATNCFRIGSAYCRDASAASAGHFPAIAVLDTASPTTVNLFNVNQQVGQLAPFTWATTDHVSFTIAYEAA